MVERAEGLLMLIPFLTSPERRLLSGTLSVAVPPEAPDRGLPRLYKVRSSRIT
jgi:hypothetical protein